MQELDLIATHFLWGFHRSNSAHKAPADLPEDALRQLRNLTQSGSKDERRLAWIALAGLRPDWEVIEAAAFEALQDEDKSIRSAALFALTQMAIPKDTAAEIALKTLKDSDCDVLRQSLNLATITFLKNPELRIAVLATLNQCLTKGDVDLSQRAGVALLGDPSERIPPEIYKFVESDAFPLNDPLMEYLLKPWIDESTDQGIALRQSLIRHLEIYQPEKLPDWLLLRSTIDAALAKASWDLIQSQFEFHVEECSKGVEFDEVAGDQLIAEYLCFCGAMKRDKQKRAAIQETLQKRIPLQPRVRLIAALNQAQKGCAEDEELIIELFAQVGRAPYEDIDLRSVRDPALRGLAFDQAVASGCWLPPGSRDLADELAASSDWALSYALRYNRADLIQKFWDEPSEVSTLANLARSMKLAFYSKNPIATLRRWFSLWPEQLVEFRLEQEEQRRNEQDPRFYYPELVFKKSLDDGFPFVGQLEDLLLPRLSNLDELVQEALSPATNSTFQAFCCALLGNYPEFRERVWAQVLKALSSGALANDDNATQNWLKVGMSLRRFGALPEEFIDSILNRGDDVLGQLEMRLNKRDFEKPILANCVPEFWALLNCKLSEHPRSHLASLAAGASLVSEILRFQKWITARQQGRPEAEIDAILTDEIDERKKTLSWMPNDDEFSQNFPEQDYFRRKVRMILPIFNIRSRVNYYSNLQRNGHLLNSPAIRAHYSQFVAQMDSPHHFNHKWPSRNQRSHPIPNDYVSLPLWRFYQNRERYFFH